MCSNILLDASGSGGSGGRAMVYHWTLLFPNDPVIADMLEGLPSFTSRVTIPASLLSPGNSYSVALNISNFMGFMASQTASVKVLSGILPNVIIPSPTKEISMLRADVLSVFAQASITMCGNSSGSAALLYQWSVTEAPGLQTTSLDPRYFTLPGFSLLVGDTFTVNVKVTSKAVGTSNYASIGIQIQKARLLAIINGGAFQTVRLSTGVFLNGTGSIDFDLPPGGKPTFSYLWSCIINMAPCELGSTVVTNGLLQVSGDYLDSGSTYTFILTVFDVTRSSNTSTKILAVGGDVPISSIDASSMPASALLGKLNPSDQVSLVGQISFASSSRRNLGLKNQVVVSAWALDPSSPTLAIGSRDLSKVALTNLTLHIPYGGSTLHYLVVKAGSLISRATYTLVTAHKSLANKHRAWQSTQFW